MKITISGKPKEIAAFMAKATKAAKKQKSGGILVRKPYTTDEYILVTKA